MSSFTNCVPKPSCLIMSTAMSTEAYCKEQRLGRIPSLTLLPAGCDKSTIRRNLLGWCGLGTRPMGLTCMDHSCQVLREWATESASCHFGCNPLIYHSFICQHRWVIRNSTPKLGKNWVEAYPEAIGQAILNVRSKCCVWVAVEERC